MAESEQRTEALEGRMSAVEQNVTHALQMIERTNHSMERGFAETREMLQTFAEQAASGRQEIHRRIEELGHETAQTRQISWPLVSILLVLVGGAVTFVRMSLAPVEKDVGETRDTVGQHLARYDEDLMMHAFAKARVEDLDLEVEKLHRITDASIIDRRQLAVDIATLKALVAETQKQQDRRWPQFLENAEHRGRLEASVQSMLEQDTEAHRAIQAHLRDHPRNARPDEANP